MIFFYATRNEHFPVGGGLLMKFIIRERAERQDSRNIKSLIIAGALPEFQAGRD